MVYPVLSSILGKPKRLDTILVNTVGNMKEDTEGSLCKNSVCRMRMNMIAGKVLC